MKTFYINKRKFPKNKKVSFSQIQSVKDEIGELEHDVEMFCLNVGQFNLIDIIEYIVDFVGECDINIATWTAANANISKAEEFINSGKARSMRWIIDPSFKSRQPAYVANLMSLFGSDCVRTIPTHAKFVTISNEKWNFVLQTSANLNQNKRLENFNISENKEFCKFFLDFVDDVFQKFDQQDLFGSQNPNQLNKVVKLEKKKKVKNYDPNFIF